MNKLSQPLFAADDCIAFLRGSDYFLILTHRSPDGDTLGSAAALCAGLRSIGKTAFVAVNPDVTSRYIPYIERYFAPEDYQARSVITVDTASLELLPEEHKGMNIDLKIDHHPAGQSYAKYELVYPDRAANGEVIFELLTAMDIIITGEIAETLYMAIATDTGCFRFSNTSPNTHRISAELMETGIDFARLNEIFFSHKSLERFAIEARLMESMEFFNDRSIAVGTLLLKTIEETSADEDDLDNLSALPRRIKGVELGALIREEKKGCRISVRTSPKYKANDICMLLGGGGHVRASGARLSLNVEEGKAALMAAIEKVRNG